MIDRNLRLLTIQATERRDGKLICVTGEIDVSTVAPLSRALEGAKDSARVVVDLENVSFIGSAGLAALMMARQRLAQGGGTLILRRPQPQACRLLELTQLDELFVIDHEPSHNPTE